MSTFGSPGGQQKLQPPKPPERGSFPLDHDGECKHIMTTYLACLKRTKGYNQEECRLLSKEYLECRMERGLMARDSLVNLGYAESQLAKAREAQVEGIVKAGIRDGALGREIGGSRRTEDDGNKAEKSAKGWWR